MAKVIVIDGNISAGKTSLCKKLDQLLPNSKVFYEPHAEENLYLPLFYKDPKRYAMTMQHWIMAHRLNNYVQMLNSLDQFEYIILDRCVFSDVVFIQKLLEDGTMTEPEFKSLMETRSELLKLISVPKHILYLDTNANVCYERVHKLRGIDCESKITLEYLQGLDKWYKTYLTDMEQNHHVKVHKIDWNNFGNMQTILDLINSI